MHIPPKKAQWTSGVKSMYVLAAVDATVGPLALIDRRYMVPPTYPPSMEASAA